MQETRSPSSLLATTVGQEAATQRSIGRQPPRADELPNVCEAMPRPLQVESSGDPLTQRPFDIHLADALIHHVFCNGMAYKRWEIARRARSRVFSFRRPVSDVLDAVFYVADASDAKQASNDDAGLSDAYHEWVRETKLFKSAKAKAEADIAAKELARYLKKVPKESQSEAKRRKNNFQTDLKLAATQQFYVADARRRFKQVTGASFADTDEHLENIKDIGGWNAVFIGRILIRTLPTTWSCEKLTAKGATKKPQCKTDVNNQWLPTIGGFISREIQAREGDAKALNGKTGIDDDAGLARAAKVAKMTEEEVEEMVRGPDERPNAVAEELGEEWKGPSRRRTPAKTMREAYRHYLSNFDVVEEGDKFAGGKWSEEMIAAFVNALKAIKPGVRPPKSLSEQEAKSIAKKVPSMAHRSHKALMRCLNKKEALIMRLWQGDDDTPEDDPEMSEDVPRRPKRRVMLFDDEDGESRSNGQAQDSDEEPPDEEDVNDLGGSVPGGQVYGGNQGSPIVISDDDNDAEADDEGEDDDEVPVPARPLRNLRQTSLDQRRRR